MSIVQYWLYLRQLIARKSMKGYENIIVKC